jgi:hypothetical protein
MKLKVFAILMILSITTSLKVRNMNASSNNKSSKIDTNILDVARRVGNPNALFEDIISLEDKYDPFLVPQKRVYDLNHAYVTDYHKMKETIIDDLSGENISYRFD